MAMEHWLAYWEASERKDFALSHVYPALEQHFDQFRGDDAWASSVLVPLCGKTPDMVWLAERGLRVVGMECAPQALVQFAAEQSLELEAVHPDHALCPFAVWHAVASNITLFEGDWFAATPTTLAVTADSEGELFDLAWDRAALVAVEPALRPDYAEVLRGLLGPRARVLLVTLEFAEASLDPSVVALGPHSVSVSELRVLFPDFDVTVLEESDVGGLSRFQRFQAAGVQTVKQYVVLMQRIAASY